MEDIESLTTIMAQVEPLLGDLGNLIYAFNSIVDTNNLTVITDQVGNMKIVYPDGITDHITRASRLSGPSDITGNMSREISIQLRDLDISITNRGRAADGLIHQGLEIEKSLSTKDSNFNSYLITQIEKFKALNKSYPH